MHHGVKIQAAATVNPAINLLRLHALITRPILTDQYGASSDHAQSDRCNWQKGGVRQMRTRL